MSAYVHKLQGVHIIKVGNVMFYYIALSFTGKLFIMSLLEALTMADTFRVCVIFYINLYVEI